MGNKLLIFWLAGTICLVCGCDSVTRYQITSTIFDGVPRMPPAEQYCQEYHERATAADLEAEKKKQMEAQKTMASSHPPYAEKRCNDCHDKSTDSGFIVAAKDLCATCHPDMIKGAYVHGPTAVGACLKCHEPHDSPQPSLLKKPKGQICGDCHVEKRLAKGLHDTARAKGMECTACHDPHMGNNGYFLR